ncbi:MAG: hypothetical protein MPJ50_01875 [Pirellulales bacterium]|nr:hypothetical protein [Pirellulales bacterium]
MSDITQIRAIKSQTLALLAELTASPKPSYSLDGQQVSWSDYLRQLVDTVEWCDSQLRGEEPAEVRSRGFTR